MNNNYLVYHLDWRKLRSADDDKHFNIIIGDRKPDYKDFELYYDLAGIVLTDSLDDVYRLTNHIDHSWTENPEVIQSADRVRSTSVGDVIYDVNEKRYHVVATEGFSEGFRPALDVVKVSPKPVTERLVCENKPADLWLDTELYSKDFKKIKIHLLNGQKILAVKVVREKTGKDVLDSKKIVDELQKTWNIEAKPEPKVELVKFEVGKKYSCRSICDHNCVWIYEVVRRTKKSIWIKERKSEKVIRKLISVYRNEEQVSPHGKYSMSAILGANDLVTE